MRDLLKGKKCMVWSFMGNSRMFEALRDHGDRFDTVGIFTFEVDITGTIRETGTSIAGIQPYIDKWTHIKWMLTVMNHGTASIFTALRNNTNGAKTKFLSELIRIMEKYPWCAGVDIDLERGGGYENKDAANLLFRDIYNTVKNYNRAKLVNICLPGMTGVQGSVGNENWAVYADLNPYCDTAAIMSYGMAWAGSAPGPVSPRSWLEGIYDYAVRSMTPEKVFMGLPAYGWNWRIHDTPANMGMTYRGISNTYYAAQNWLLGKYNFTSDAPPQPFIPFFGYWDDVDMVPWLMPHVYDFMEGGSYLSKQEPLMEDSYNRRSFLTTYRKQQRPSFGTIYVDKNGVPDEGLSSGNLIVGETTVTFGDKEATAKYRFTVPATGTYDVALRIGFPFYDKNHIGFYMDGNNSAAASYHESRLWWPYWRSTCWIRAYRMTLSAGIHVLAVNDAEPGVMLYGFRVCSAFEPEVYAGEADFRLSPRSFIDVNGNTVVPDKGFKLTTEVLRRKPDSALIWYEDFRDEAPLNPTFWQISSGQWSVWHDPESSLRRPYSQLEGQGEIGLNYTGFRDIHIRVRVAFPSNGNGRAGAYVGNIFCCININTNRVELYQGSTMLGSYNSAYERTPQADLRKNPKLYMVEMRIRGNSVRVYSGSASTFRFTANIGGAYGYAGIRSDGPIVCDLMRIGDSWTYEPYEAFDIVMPDGSRESYGRISRQGVTWDNEFQVFRINSDIEETATRTEDISMDFDFVHSRLLPVPCNQDYTATIVPKDINIWFSRLFFGDADGFSIVYYQDVDSLVYWSNEAAYRWGLRGIAIWSLGQEDMRLWSVLPQQNE